MNLTGKQLVEQGIIGNAPEECVQQHSIDLQVIKIEKIIGGGGLIPVQGKTLLAERIEVETKVFNQVDAWYLQPGLYDVTYAQSCSVPTNQRLTVRSRSSLVRNGANVRCGLYDAGFSSNFIGSMLKVDYPILIEKGARIATASTETSNEVDNLYSGQFQEDKQRLQQQVDKIQAVVDLQTPLNGSL